MKMSQMFGKTIKEVPSGASALSHILLYRGGYIRESTAGRYYFLPLGLRVHKKVMAVIKSHMDASGGQELVTPVLHPLALWTETNRNKSVGFELMQVTDRSKAQFVLGGTAEEMLVDLVRKFTLSYRDLPFNLYQFSTKFRDEKRARGGLLRLREFVMKDAYSFDVDEAAFKNEYQKMESVYTAIFSELGLKTAVVESDNGYIGGDYCHEFIVESEVGESRYFTTASGTYSAHEEVARFVPDDKNLDDTPQPQVEVEAVRGHTMTDGVKLHNLPLWQQLKTVAYQDESGKVFLVAIRGDLDVNEVKLKKVLGGALLKPATAEAIASLGSHPGFISPVGMEGKAHIIADISLNTVTNFYTGANRNNRDLLNCNYKRDFTAHIEADVAQAAAGHIGPNGEELIERKGIEVGNIFQLGLHYTSLMKGATYKNEQGENMPFYMGCYGIGVARTMAAIVEIYGGSNSISWPKSVAPYKYHIVCLDPEDSNIFAIATNLYGELQKHYPDEVLFDNRVGPRPGERFADADLIGCSHRITIGRKSDGQTFEVKNLGSQESTQLKVDEILAL